MTDGPRSYSALTADQQAQLSVWIDRFDRGYEYEGTAALKKALQEAPDELRVVLLSQLLPPLVDHDRKQHGRTPTLHELRARFPELSGELTAAYPLLPDGYRLPVELRGYRVLQVVGEGGQAIVLRAQDDVHSAVAIKLSVSPQHNDLLLRERQLLGECQHPGVPEVIASGVEEDRAFFIMPFLRGMTLADKYATHRPSPEEAAEITAKLCDIVAHLHSRGILHRDIKPQNVWIDDSGAVKLIDLGMAIDRSSWGAPRAAVSEFHGSPAFMSPEQAAADSENDGELSDIFSIGATLYWMMTGHPPFAAETPQASLERAKSGAISPREILRLQGYPKSMKRACLRALASSPRERFASAGELEQSLRLRGRPRARLAAFAILSLGLAAGLWLFNKPPREATPDLDQAAALNQDEATSDLLLPDLAPKTEEPAAAEPIILSDAPDPPPHSPPSSNDDADDDPVLSSRTPLDERSFRVSLKSAFRYQEPFGGRLSSAKVLGVLVVQPRVERADVPGKVQYRIADLPWRTTQWDEGHAGFIAFLDKDEASKRGPIGLRLVDDSGAPIAAANDPLSYSYNVAADLKRENERFVESLLKSAASARCMDSTSAGWAVDEEFSKRHSFVMRDMWYTDDESKPMRSVARQIAALIGASDPGDGSRPSYTLKQAFALVSGDVRSSPNLWVKLELKNGKTTEPTLYTSAKVAVRKYEEQATAWFDWLGPEHEAAVFVGDQLSLTGIQNALPRLTHLLLQGEYYGYTETDKQSLSSNGSSSQRKQASLLRLDVSKLNGKTTFRLPPIWSSVTIRGRLGNGKTTPGFIARNEGVSCGVALQPVAFSSEPCAIEAYLFVSHGELPIEDLSILKHLPDADKLPPKTAEDCLATRLKLKAMLPPGAARADFYSDPAFRRPLAAPAPGMLYVQYTGQSGEVLGDSTYRIEPALFQEWVEHGRGHFFDLSSLRADAEAESTQAKP